MMASRGRGLLLGALLLCARADEDAVAHPFSVSYSRSVVTSDRVVTTVRLPLDDMDLLLRMDRDLDGTVSAEEITATRSGLEQYLAKHVQIRADEQELAQTLDRTAEWRDQANFPYVEAVLVSTLSQAPTALAVRVSVLTDLYSDHRTIGEVEWGDRREQFVFERGRLFEATQQATPWWQTARTFVALGIEHILTGYDHLLFLLGLLVAGQGMRQLVVIVTSFTVAHSVTLAAATFGLIEPPPQLVEVVIALSIAYVGVENLVVQEIRGRWRLTFLFGLVHGFGFANVLRDMNLPRQALATSLFTFNVGVEVGQVAFVLLLWPALKWLQRTKYRLPVTRFASVLIAGFGFMWFVQRLVASWKVGG